MNNRIFVLVVFLFVLIVGTLRTYAQDEVYIKGELDFPPEVYNNDFDIRSNISVYTFLTMDYAQRALQALNDGKKVTTAENDNRPYKPDKFGCFSLYMPKGGFLLVWCIDRHYKAKVPIIPHANISSSGFKVQFISTKAENEKELDAVEIIAKSSGVTLAPKISVLEGPDGMVRTMRHKIPFRITEYMRVIAQPILFDRSDISDANSDTVFSFGRATYFDMSEYSLTQEHRMDFDLGHDSINYYISLQGDSLYHSQFDSSVSIDNKPHVTINETNDTIDIYVSDRFSGYDPDTSHPYPYGIHVSIHGYNSEIYSEYYKDNGERREPLRFLNFSFKEFLPDKNDFVEIMDDQRLPHPGELKLNFEPGKAVLAHNDTISFNALKKLEHDLRKAQNSGDREELYRIFVYGIASPEGDLKKNEKLAQERAGFAANKIRSYVPKTVPISIRTSVAEWKILADSLKSAGYDDVASAVYEIVNKYPLKGKNDTEGFKQQEIAIRNLPQYNTLIRKEFLPKLRTVTYNYVINKLGKLPSDTVIARYRRDPKKPFTRGEYWDLFNNLHDKRELEAAAKIALKTTRDTISVDTAYCSGYWPYAASVLACSYIARDTVDLELLRPFLNLTLYKDVNGEDSIMPMTQKGSVFNPTRIVQYINYPDMAANQLIMALKSKDACTPKEIAALECIIENKAKEEPAYERLMAFSMCLRGKYNSEEPKYVKARDYVAGSSLHNFVVMALAMDDPTTIEDDDEWLLKAYAKIDSLEQNNATDYLKAVAKTRIAARTKLNARNSILAEAEALLANICINDLKYLLIASNDDDLIIKDGSKYKIFKKALNLWSVEMDKISTTEDSPYYWFKLGIDEALSKSPKEAVVSEYLEKCFSLDSRYITVLNVYMRDRADINKKEELLTMLRRVRNRYILRH